MDAFCWPARLNRTCQGAFRLAAALTLGLAAIGCGGGGGGEPGSPPMPAAVAVDTDGDGTPDATDTDDDNDGVEDADDPYPLDPNRGPEPVSVPDPALRAALLRRLGKEPGDALYAHELAALRDLIANDAGITSLEGLQSATGLVALHFNDNPISDLSPLSGLTKLERLGFWNNAVADLSPLSGLTELRRLSFLNNAVADLSPLSGLTKLEHLTIGINAVVDLSPLSGLTELEFLDSGDNAVVDLSPLSGLTKLRELHVSHNQIVDVAPLSQLTALWRLSIGVNHVEDLAPLSNLTGMRELSVASNPLIDIAPLSFLTNLTHLNLVGTGVSSLEPLSNLTKLEGLNVGYNERANDLAPISGLPGLRTLSAPHNKLSDLSPLAGLTTLEVLYLPGNEISDLSPLSSLTELTRLELRDNQITDLSPLVDNLGLDSGDRLNVLINPLNDASINSHAPALSGRGVEVAFDAFVVRAGDGPRIHNDNVLVLPVPGGMEVDDGRLTTEDIATGFYSHFGDAFDFLMIISHRRVRENPSINYVGAYFAITNDTQGIGGTHSPEAIRHGSAGRLQGLIVFPHINFSIKHGPSLHEIMHRWGNYVVKPHPHWGFTSAYGQLGGFRAEDLVDLGGGRYTAGVFSNFINGGGVNGVPYSPIELYLAGLIPPDEVPDLLVAEDAEWLRDDDGYLVRTDGGQPIFTATRIVTRAVEDIVAEHGIRTPDHTQSQRTFRAAAVLLIDETRPVYESRLDSLSKEVAELSSVEETTRPYNFYTFHQATGGRAAMAMDGLSEFNTGTPVAPTPHRISARSARMPDDDRAVGQPRFGLLFQELEGNPFWPQVTDGRFDPVAPHPAWCKHESHAHARTFGPPRARR
ncbi:MAG: leucine-rich repeat domain-containing protein [Gammaproteobacteria bacterium]|nr:leucine-rich repeat domain-containing protein [Gammaproteobacteria bacterium]MDE0271493.1 leucine-rich repeat domain-containing protein [Gammaproteobacteria bacterium]